MTARNEKLDRLGGAMLGRRVPAEPRGGRRDGRAFDLVARAITQVEAEG